MSFASALNLLRPTLPYYLALVKYGLLRLTKDSFEFDPNPAAPPWPGRWRGPFSRWGPVPAPSPTS